MAYAKHSPQAVLGAWYELDVARRARRNGWHVLHTSEIGDGATMATGPDGQKLILPDLQLFDVIRGRKSRLVEIKVKRGAYPYQKLRIDCTGCDWPKWLHYLQLLACGLPVDMAFIHMHWPLRFSPEIAPKLLWQTVETLATHGPMQIPPCKQFPGGGAVWDVNDFDILGDLPNPPQHILNALEAIKCNLHIWEKPPKLRRPRKVPGQWELPL